MMASKTLCTSCILKEVNLDPCSPLKCMSENIPGFNSGAPILHLGLVSIPSTSGFWPLLPQSLTANLASDGPDHALSSSNVESASMTLNDPETSV